MMNHSNRLLMTILGTLTLSVLVTGGLALYLTLSRAQGGNAPAAEQPAAIVQSTDTLTGAQHIAFVSDQDGEVAIYTMSADGSNVRRASNSDLNFCIFPAWSPDGQRVAYAGTTGDPFADNDGEAAVWVSAADGSQHVQVSDAKSGLIQPLWSPDGARLAFVSWEKAEGEEEAHSVIHIVRADSGEVERNLTFPSEIHQLAWSPIEDKLLVVSGDPDARTYVHLMSTDSAEITELFRGAMMADWSPDGESIVVGDYTSQDVLVIELEDDQDLTPRPIAQMTMQPVEIAWSPDGARIAVATAGHYRQGYATIMKIITVETGEIATLAEGHGWVGWPRWSSDGQRLTFTWGHLSRSPGMPRADLWLYDVASGQTEQLTAGEGFEGMGVWSP